MPSVQVKHERIFIVDDIFSWVHNYPERMHYKLSIALVGDGTNTIPEPDWVELKQNWKKACLIRVDQKMPWPGHNIWREDYEKEDKQVRFIMI